MKKYIIKIQVILVILFINGCASTYPCGEPDAGKCSSVTSNYDKSFNDYTNMDDLPQSNSLFSSEDGKSTKKMKFEKYSQTPSNGSPLVSQPTMMRVWLTAYTDNDNIFHEQSYEYMLTDKGHWIYGNNSMKINTNIKNISLIQGINDKSNQDGSFGLPISAVSSIKSTNPTSMLNDYPAFNALKNQTVPIKNNSTNQNNPIVYPN
jgi:hypothetical protein